jgi:hypothetical protein
MHQLTKLALLLVVLMIGGCATNSYQQVYSGDTQIYCNSPKDEAYCDREGDGYQDEDARYRIQIQPPGRVPPPPSPGNSDISNFPRGPPQ